MTMDDGRFLQPAWQPEAKEHFCAWLLQLLTPEGDGESNQPLQAALTHFLHSDAVYQASENFLATLAALWQMHYPDHRPLILPHVEPLAAPLPEWDLPTCEAAQASFVEVLDACDNLMHSVETVQVVPQLSCALPLATVGVPYRARVQFSPRSQADVQVLGLDLPPETALHFNVHTGECFGLPAQAGTFAFNVHWQNSDEAVETTEGYIEIAAVSLQNPPHVLTASNMVLQDVPLTGRLIGVSVRGQAALYAQQPCVEDVAVGVLPDENWQVLVMSRANVQSSIGQQVAMTVCRLCRETLLQALAEDNSTLLAALAAWEAQPLTGTRILKQTLGQIFLKAAQASLTALEPFEAAAEQLLLTICHQDTQGTFVASFYLGRGVIAVLHGVGKVSLMSVPTVSGRLSALSQEALQDSQDLWQRVQFGRFHDAKAVLLLGAGTVAPYFVQAADVYHTEYWLAFGQQVCPLLKNNDPFPALVDWLGRYTPQFEADRSLVAFLPNYVA